MVVAWLTDQAEMVGIDPTTLVIRATDGEGIGDDLAILDEVMRAEPDMQSVIRQMADMARRARGITWGRLAAEESGPYESHKVDDPEDCSERKHGNSDDQPEC